MIRQVNYLYSKCHDDVLVYLSDYSEICNLINAAVQEPPQHNDTALVAFPINAIFDYSMNTPVGMDFFSSMKVNDGSGDTLRYWGEYLSSASSLKVFIPKSEGGGGWSDPEAVLKAHIDWFAQTDPDAIGWGYRSERLVHSSFQVGYATSAGPVRLLRHRQRLRVQADLLADKRGASLQILAQGTAILLRLHAR